MDIDVPACPPSGCQRSEIGNFFLPRLSCCKADLVWIMERRVIGKEWYSSPLCEHFP
jgi:hypothetical protein